MSKRPTIEATLAAAFSLAACVVACGGRIGAEDAPADGGSPGLDAIALPAADAPGLAPDAAAGAEAAPTPCDVYALGAALDELSQQPGFEGHRFLRDADFAAFVRELAVVNAFVDPAHAVDCTAGLATCTYEPRSPRLDATDLHYSDAVQRFVGPDEEPYAWAYVPARNTWILVDRNRDPSAYAVIVQLNACVADGG
jgi:hypothetical protein